MKTNIIFIGLGPMGRAIAAAALAKPWIEIIGAVDPAPSVADASVREILRNRNAPDLTVAADLKSWLETKEQGKFASDTKTAAVVATSSRIADLAPVLEQLFARGISVVSTCEQMSFPMPEHIGIWKKIDSLAKLNKVSAVGTGINPGFLMDLLPLVLTAPCTRINSIRIERILDTRRRRKSFQRKMGAGLSTAEFEHRRKTGIIGGHVGLEASLMIIAEGLGWTFEEIRHTPLQPVSCEGDSVISGIFQSVRGRTSDGKIIELEFTASEDADEADRITIDGEPVINQVIKPCIHGDTGTAGMVLNSIPGLLRSSPGMHTLLDLPISRFC